MKIEMTPHEFAEYEEYLKHHRSKRDPAWITLQRDITSYCQKHKSMRRSFFTQQNFIYGAIKLVTGINQINQISGEQVGIARCVFNDLASKRRTFSRENN